MVHDLHGGSTFCLLARVSAWAPLLVLPWLAGCSAGKVPEDQLPASSAPAESSGTVALLSLVEEDGNLRVTGVRKLTNEKFRPVAPGPDGSLGATHQWSLRSAKGVALASGTIRVQRTVEVPPGGPPDSPQQGVITVEKVVALGLHVPWPARGQYVAVDRLDTAGAVVPNSTVVWP